MLRTDPPHPGEIVREDFLEPLGLSVTEGAAVLGVARHTLQSLIDERDGISSEMAIRLEKAFGLSADVWLRLQMAYDLARARARQGEIHVTPYVQPEPIGV